MPIYQQNTSATAQGIFLNWHDYENNKIVRADGMSLNHLLEGKCVDITFNGKSSRYWKDSIFGYRDKDGNDYRFYMHSDEFQILEHKKIVIYAIYSPTHTSKGLSPPLVPQYYFSKTLNSNIFPLTINNLKDAFPDNHKFHHLLDDEFNNGKPVYDFDAEHQMFKVNYLLNKSLN